MNQTKHASKKKKKGKWKNEGGQTTRPDPRPRESSDMKENMWQLNPIPKCLKLPQNFFIVIIIIFNFLFLKKKNTKCAKVEFWINNIIDQQVELSNFKSIQSVPTPLYSLLLNDAGCLIHHGLEFRSIIHPLLLSCVYTSI